MRIPIFPSRIGIKEFKYFYPKKTVSELSEILSWIFIPDPDLVFLPIPVKKAPDPGSATLLPHCILPSHSAQKSPE
jgi:hypothetical protein